MKKFEIPTKKKGIKTSRDIPKEKKLKPEEEAKLHPMDKKPNQIRKKYLDADGRIQVVPGQAPENQRVIDWDFSAEMLKAGCDAEEIASKMGVKPAELKARCLQETGQIWAELESAALAEIKYKLRSQILRSALGYYRKGQDGKMYFVPSNPVMLIHAAKFILGQTDSSLGEGKNDYVGYIFQDEEGNFAEGEEMPEGIIDGIAVVVDLDD